MSSEIPRIPYDLPFFPLSEGLPEWKKKEEEKNENNPPLLPSKGERLGVKEDRGSNGGIKPNDFTKE